VYVGVNTPYKDYQAGEKLAPITEKDDEQI